MRLALPRALVRVALAASLSLLSGCARHYRQVRYPFTAEQLATWTGSKGEVLMTYLLQPSASVSVCDAHSKGAHVNLSSKEDLAEVVDGLGRGVDPQRWRKCVDLLMPSLAPAGNLAASSFFAEMGHAYKSLIRDSDLEKDPRKVARLEALHQIYLERPVGYGADADTMKSLTASLRSAVTGRHLSPTGLRFGTELLETLEIETGAYRGAPVTVASLDALAAEHNDAILLRLSRRLPDASLREQALRRLVRMRIAASPFPEVVAQADEVERVVVAQGFYPVSLDAHPVATAEMQKGLSTMRVAIFQDPWKQVAELLSEQPGNATPTNMPEQDLRGSLAFTAEGISRPITLCGPHDAYDPSPCLPSSLVELRNPFVLLEAGGTLRFRENVREVDVFAMGAFERFTIPVVVGGKTLGTISWALRFLRPKDMIFAPRASGALGPTLTVDADNRLPSRVLYRIGSPMGEFLAVVQVPDAPAFHVMAAGGEGYAGTPGAQGSPGTDGANGASGSCGGGSGSSGENGGPGGPGGDGTNGGPGGHGGRVLVNVHCDAASCGNLSRLLGEGIRAPGGRGGAGGAAGRGGPGGRGGYGGAGATCTNADGSSYSVSGGSNGSNGPDGPSGRSGRDGRAGPDGQVVIQTLPFVAAKVRP